MSGSNSSDPAASGLNDPMAMTVHALPSTLPADVRTRRGRWKMIGILLVCAAPVIASYFTYFVLRPDGRTNYSDLIEPVRPMPALTLRGLDGSSVDAASLRGQWLLVSLSGGSCDAACGERLYLQRQLREMMGRDKDRVDKVWLILDDAAPPPGVRTAVASDPALHALRTSREAVQAWLQPQDGQALESHVYVVDPLGNWMMRAPANPDPARLKRDLTRLLRASAGWDQPGR